MRPVHALLLVVGLCGVAAATVHVMHPSGLDGAIRSWTGRTDPATSGSGGGGGSDPLRGTTGEPAVAQPKRSNREQIEQAQRNWDRGDFDGAVSAYMAARALAGDDTERAKAVDGLHRSLMAWALCVKPPRDVAAASLPKLVSTAESAGTEKAWFDALRAAAALRAADRLPYLAAQAIDAARPGGPVEGLLVDSIRDAGNRGEDLAVALTRRGLGAGARAGSASSGGTSPSGGTGNDPPQSTRSGISGTTGGGIPYGSFSSAMREKLRDAVEWERQGRNEADLAAPDGTERVAHARKAVALLKQAREVYMAARDEDPESRGLDDRISRVTRLLSDLKKTLPIGD
ncbi:MAG: hypothetical protein HMLKMBBP_03283 [Planctomycetes bacterium]|nr:hypothetical protein [Planctomycetota bacterium]